MVPYSAIGMQNAAEEEDLAELRETAESILEFKSLDWTQRIDVSLERFIPDGVLRSATAAQMSDKFVQYGKMLLAVIERSAHDCFESMESE